MLWVCLVLVGSSWEIANYLCYSFGAVLADYEVADAIENLYAAKELSDGMDVSD